MKMKARNPWEHSDSLQLQVWNINFFEEKIMFRFTENFLKKSQKTSYLKNDLNLSSPNWMQVSEPPESNIIAPNYRVGHFQFSKKFC